MSDQKNILLSDLLTVSTIEMRISFEEELKLKFVEEVKILLKNNKTLAEVQFSKIDGVRIDFEDAGIKICEQKKHDTFKIVKGKLFAHLGEIKRNATPQVQIVLKMYLNIS